MNELQRQQQKAREVRDRLYGKPKVVNVFKPKLVAIDEVKEPEIIPAPVMFREPVEIEIEPIPETPVTFQAPVKRYMMELAARTPFSYEEIIGHKHKREIVAYRYAIIAKVRHEFPSLSYPQIGRLFNRDHTTIIYACKRATDIMDKLEKREEILKNVRDFVLKKCDDLELSYADLIGVHDSENLKSIRNSILIETYKRFPNATQIQMGSIFNRSEAHIYRLLEGKYND